MTKKLPLVPPIVSPWLDSAWVRHYHEAPLHPELELWIVLQGNDFCLVNREHNEPITEHEAETTDSVLRIWAGTFYLLKGEHQLFI